MAWNPMGTTALFTSPGCRRPTSEGPWAQSPKSCSLSWDLYRVVPPQSCGPQPGPGRPWASLELPALPGSRCSSLAGCQFSQGCSFWISAWAVPELTPNLSLASPWKMQEYWGAHCTACPRWGHTHVHGLGSWLAVVNREGSSNPRYTWRAVLKKTSGPLVSDLEGVYGGTPENHRGPSPLRPSFPS